MPTYINPNACQQVKAEGKKGKKRNLLIYTYIILVDCDFGYSLYSAPLMSVGQISKIGIIHGMIYL